MRTLASGAAAGVTLGYLVYVCIHYAARHLPSIGLNIRIEKRYGEHEACPEFAADRPEYFR